MSINHIPVHVVGPGSQPDAGQELKYIEMPHDMATFRAPHIPEPDKVEHLAGAREAMRWLGNALSAYGDAGEPQLADLTALDTENRALVNQILGEGEVSVVCNGEVTARCQESTLAGVWRTLFFDDEERVFCDLLEVAATPQLLDAAEGNDRPIDTSRPASAEAVASAMPILVEVQASAEAYAANGTPHSINLSLLPLSESEIEFLDERLGRGAIDVLSRGYGKCQVISTAAPNVWWVRYYNSMGTPILNSIEVTAIPEIIVAADEDLRDSAERLGDILAPYWPEAS